MMNTDLRLSGTKIQEVLDVQGRRQDWLAAQLEVAPATVNRWIRGNRQVDVATAKRIAVILGVPFSTIWNMPIDMESIPVVMERIPA